MVSVKQGDVYEVQNRRRGVGKQGDYMLFEVISPNGHERITLFVNNPKEKGMAECNRIKVLDITEATRTKKLYNGKWYENYNVYIYGEAITDSDKKFEDFMGGPTEEEINALFGLD